jgi:hypothetical protein
MEGSMGGMLRHEQSQRSKEAADPHVEKLLGEGRELHEKAQEALDMHVANLEGLEAMVANDDDLQDSPHYLILHNKLLHRIYEAGMIVEDAEKVQEEDKAALRDIAA